MTEIAKPNPRSWTGILESVAHFPVEDQLEAMLELMETQDREMAGKQIKRNCAVMEVNGARLEINDVSIKRKGRLMCYRDDSIITLNHELSDEEWFKKYGSERGVYTYTELRGTIVTAEGQTVPLSQIYDKSPTLFFRGQPESTYDYILDQSWGTAARGFLDKGFNQIIFTSPRAAYPQVRMHGFAANDRVYLPQVIETRRTFPNLLRIRRRRR